MFNKYDSFSSLLDILKRFKKKSQDVIDNISKVSLGRIHVGRITGLFFVLVVQK